MTRQPDLKQTWIIPQIIQAPPNMRIMKYILPATGFLLGIAVNPNGSAELNCHLGDYTTEQIDGTEFQVDMAMTSGGIIFEKPLENMSRANPFILVVKARQHDSPSIPNLTIYPIGAWGVTP